MTWSIDRDAIWNTAQAWFAAAERALSDLAGTMTEIEIAGLATVSGGALILCVVWIIRRRHRRPPVSLMGDLTLLTRGPKRLGLGAAVVFVVIFGGWSAYAPLASATLAPGVIGPDGYRKTVQHLEGGIVRYIHVREGDTVAAGDPLITLDDTTARSQDAEIRERFLYMLATGARLEAEQSDAVDIVFPEALLADDTPGLKQIIEGQRQILHSRRKTLASRIAILETRILQLGQQNSGLEQVIAAEEEQLALINEEIASAEVLLAQGLERKPKILGLQRMRSQIDASRAMNRARIAENAEAIGEVRLQLIAVEEERREETAAELANARRVLSELRGQIPPREKILERTVIRAPIGGTLMNLRVTTEGGVVRPSEPIAEIVPSGAQLIINARVQPNDIDRITPGMSARVVLTAYTQRNLPFIHGTLQSISPDALVEERTGLAYFLAKVEVDPREFDESSQVQLVPGMPAEIMFLEGERSTLEYFLAPILESRRRSFLEE